MAISSTDINENLRHIVLSGRLDFHGVEAIVDQFASLLTSAQRVVVDLTGANLICSMGIRTLILNAKTLQQRGGRMALVVEENTTISKTLKSVGIDSLLPVFNNFSSAERALQN